MKFVAQNTSVVIVADMHNPTILHPFFLASQEIVPADWPLSELPVCTPAIAAVKYQNGIVLNVDPKKVTVRDNAPTPESPIPSIASKYVEALPHVHYSAVGLNISGYAENSNPEHWVIERFLKDGPGNNELLRPNAVGIKF